MLKRSAACFLGFFSLIACGGKVFVDGGGTGGAAAGGVGGSRSHAGAGGFSSTGVVGAGGTITAGVGGFSASSAGAGGGSTCPNDASFGVNASCTQEGQTCPIRSCCAMEVMCTAGVWELTTSAPCEEVCIQCGPDAFSCSEGDLCIENSLQTATTYQCDVNPCSGPADCSCAASVCGSLTCEGVDNGVVTCDCPDC